MLSNTCKYGIRALIYMAINAPDGEKIGIKKIADDLTLPGPFLGKILQTVAKKKVLNSYKGPNGGFSFAKDPYEVTFLEIIHILDGEESFDGCFLGLKICDGTPEGKEKCPAHVKTQVLRNNIQDVFSSTTIGGMANEIVSAGNSTNIKMYF